MSPGTREPEVTHSLCARCNQIALADIHVYGHAFEAVQSPLEKVGSRLPPIPFGGSPPRCTCKPCERPEGMGGSQPGTHCAACCYGTGIEQYDLRCPWAEHRHQAYLQDIAYTRPLDDGDGDG